MNDRPPRTRRDAILSAALLQFSQHGYDGASMRGIASEAKVSLTLLSHHFQTKAGIFKACALAVEQVDKDHAGRLLATLPKSGAPATVSEWVSTWISTLQEAYASADGRASLRLTGIAAIGLAGESSQASMPSSARNVFANGVLRLHESADPETVLSACEIADAWLRAWLSSEAIESFTVQREALLIDMLVAAVEAAARTVTLSEPA